MTDPVLGGVGLGLVWGWWLVLAASPTSARTGRAAVVLGSSSLALGGGIALLAGLPSVVAAVVAAGSASIAHIAFKAALREQRHHLDA
jgi:hypothetical protein